LGIDLAPFIVKGFDNSRSGLGFSGRLNIKQKIFAAVEVGYENVSFTNLKRYQPQTHKLSPAPDTVTGRTAYRFGYLSNGTYLKGGLDYNLFSVDEPGNLDNVLVGFRYGYAYQQHESPSYTIGNGYWGDFQGQASSSSANSHWVELLFGIRTETFRNLFMGWTVRVNRLIYQSNTSLLEPAVIPGFGKFNGKITAGFSYTIEYQIPFNKRSKIAPPIK
jgi:hypothetical protein